MDRERPALCWHESRPSHRRARRWVVLGRAYNRLGCLILPRGDIIHLKRARGHIVDQRVEMVTAFGSAKNLAGSFAKATPDPLPHKLRQNGDRTRAKTRV